MANKKITVVGDGVEEPLTPEEEHQIEVKVDKMLDPSVPDTTAATPPTASAPVPVAPPVAPKITKIVTKFADETPDESVAPKPIEPAPASVLAPELEVAPPAPAPSKPVAKKITVRHHDDEVEATAEPEKSKTTKKAAATKTATDKPTAKSKARKATTKKTAKKHSTPAADPAAELAAQAEAIAASAQAAEELKDAKSQPLEVETPAPVEEPVVAAEAEPIEAAELIPDPNETEAVDKPSDTELPESTADQNDGAPPLILKHAAAPIGTPTDSAAEAVRPGTEADSTSPQATPEEVLGEVAEPSESSQPTSSFKITVNEPAEIAEEVPVEVESAGESEAGSEISETAPAVAEGEKKYRPPDGPLQFKRADVPIQPLKPGEPRPESPADELSEDEALARAFEAPKSTAKPEKAPKRSGGKLRTVLIVLIILVVAAGGAIAAAPSLRQKAKDLVGLGKKTPAASTSVATSTTTPVAAPLNPDLYVAKKDSIFNVYQVNADGQQQKLVLAGTGNETSDLVLAPNAAATAAALVSTRDGTKDSAGNPQESVALITVATGKATTLDTAAHIKLVDWFGDRLVYVISTAGTSTTDTNRYQIISYNIATKTRTVLDHANYLNDVLAANGAVYYATAASSGGAGQFLAIKPDATGKQGILSAEVAAITRTSYDSFVLSTINKWYSYHSGDLEATATNAVQSQSRQYVDSPDGKHSVYLDKSNLVLLDTATAKETQLGVPNASYPIRWLSNDTLLYRNGEADFRRKITGGQPTKITDVSDVAGINLWHE